MRTGTLVHRLGAAALLCWLAAVVAVTGHLPPSTGDQTRLAADTRLFDAGNIISDAEFFDPTTMSVAAVQAFLDGRGAHCRTGSDGTPCLRVFRQDTFDRSADGLCGRYAGGRLESAATIVVKVARACSVNPRVLLVLLQKEQGLVTSTGGAYLTARRYQAATGMGCPDTAACDTQYYGFYNQVYGAARQFQKYAHNPQSYAHRAGAWNYVRYDVEASCGSSRVHIANQATAGLYNYTPYQPNAAALRAGYGSGDGCSAYGNRNFWLYYTDWFGSTHGGGGDAVTARYEALGGATGSLGPALSVVACGLKAGGCHQDYANGSISWSAATGARVTGGAVRTRWVSAGREAGVLGYPVADMTCGLPSGGCSQDFQGGSVSSGPDTGARIVSGQIRQVWAAQGRERGSLGHPITEATCALVADGCLQKFQGGNVYSSPTTGAHAVPTGPIAATWATHRWEKGALGYPTTGQRCALLEDGCIQKFQGGSIYWSPTTGAHAVPTGPIATAWATHRWEKGALGYPTTGQDCSLVGEGCTQRFRGGSLYWSAGTGAQAVLPGPIAAAWAAREGERGSLGYPTGGQECDLARGGCSQGFRGGTVYWSAGTGAYPVTAPVAGSWQDRGAEAGALGYPVADMSCSPSRAGCWQQFDAGLLATSSAGSFVVPEPIAAAWLAQDAASGRLGSPTGDQVCGLTGGGCSQRFQGGRIYTSSAGGTRAVLAGPIGNAWAAGGAEAGPLGYPVRDQVCGLARGGCMQRFAAGSIYTSAASGTRTVPSGPIARTWAAHRWERGRLGYPVSAQICGLRDGGCVQRFGGGSIYTSPAGGTRVVPPGPLADAWAAQRWERGRLGYPVSARVCGLRDRGCLQRFQGGAIYTSAAGGTHTVPVGPIADAWAAQRWERGRLGYPVTGQRRTSTGFVQGFQGGILRSVTSTGEVTVSRR